MKNGTPRRLRSRFLGFLCVFAAVVAVFEIGRWGAPLNREYIAWVGPIAFYVAALFELNLDMPDDWRTIAAQGLTGLVSGLAWGVFSQIEWDIALKLGLGLAAFASLSRWWLSGRGLW